MSEPDFSGIDPLRVPEARRRVAAITEYLRLPDPSAADTQRIATSIGVSRTQFTRLARVWRDHRDARLLVIGKRGTATRDYGIDPRAVDIANKVIAAADGTATLAKEAPEIERLCAEAAVAPPSRQTIYNYIRKFRLNAPAPVTGPPRIVIGRMWFHLPIDGMPRSAMPTLLAAVLLPERIVLAHTVSTDPEIPPSVNDVIDAIAALRTPASQTRPLLLDPDDRRVGTDALVRADLTRIRPNNHSVQRELSIAFAGALGPLAAIYQRGMARPGTKRVITRQDEALPARTVRDIVVGAVDSHNAGTLMEVPAFDIASD